MRLKYFLRGLGAGIIFTAVICAFVYRTLPAKKMSQQDIISEAKKLGMMEKDLRLPETSVSPSPAPAAPSIKPTKSPEITPTPTPVQQPAKPSASPQDSGSPSSSVSPDTVSFKISSGMLSNQVAKLLEEKNLVKDAGEFDFFLVQNHYQKRIRTGEYKIPAGASYKEIAEIITK